MSRLGKFIVLFLVVLVSVVGVVLYLGSGSKEDWLATDVKPVTPHYLTTTFGVETKIFLVNASAMYSFWRENDTIIGYNYEPPPPGVEPINPVVKTGDPMFIIDATVRNDYLPEDSPKVGYYASRDEWFSWVSLHAKVFYENGTEIPSINTDARKGMVGYVFELGANKPRTIEVPLATESRDIAYYEFYVNYVQELPR